MTSLIVGCPVKDRAWIISYWFNHVQLALDVLGEDLDVIFVFVSPYGDCSLDDFYDRDDVILSFSEEEAGPYLRRWNDSAYVRMAAARNQLLSIVRYHEPDYFLSLDSDILVDPVSLQSLFDCLDRSGADAVGGKVFMEEIGTSCPSHGIWTDSAHRRFHRKNSDNFMPVDILMAFKLMTPAAYGVNYDFHPLGEDIGWSHNCSVEGLKFYWDGRVTSKHVMSREGLTKVDKRCGF